MSTPTNTPAALLALPPIAIEDLADLLADSLAFEFTDHGSTRLYSGVDENGRHYIAAMNNLDGGCFIGATVSGALAPFTINRDD